MIVTVIGGPKDGQRIEIPDGATSLHLPILRKLDTLDILGPDDPETFPLSSGAPLYELLIRDHCAFWDARR